MNKVVVIGGGASGIFSAISSRKNGDEVYIIEKNDRLGKKLRITGKGRCNITFAGDEKDFMNNILVNSKFLYSSYQRFNNKDVLDFFKSIGVDSKLERGNRYFPVSDSATMLVEALIKEVKRLGINVIYSAKVTDILKEESKVTGVTYLKNNKEYTLHANKVIIATGGASYSQTGSTGDGYTLAKNLGHTIVDICPALVPLKVLEEDEMQSLNPLSLRNIQITVKNQGKELYSAFGEMLFATFGLTGPVILSASSKLSRIKNIEQNMKNKSIKIYIDLKPALTEEKLDHRVQRDFEKYSNKEFQNSLGDLLPKKLIDIVIKRSKISPKKKVHQITKEERQKLVYVIKNLEYTLVDFLDLNLGIVTAGGVNVKEIDPKTMMSKKIDGLYFCGEVMDLDGYTGGFNLQIAFTTGYVAGMS